jgi:transcriptional regulator with GAF, ATPase, and Fis domain
VNDLDFELYRVLFEELDPNKLTKRFLGALLRIQNVERGSIWVKRGNRYLCIEALGGPEDTEIVKGTGISVDQPSIVGWVIENGRMTIAEPGKDPRHCKEIEAGLETKSQLILSFPLILRNGEVYGAINLIDTSSGGNRMNLDETLLKLLQKIVDMGSIAMSNAIYYTEQRKENLELQHALEEIRRDVEIIGQSRLFLDVMKSVRDYARTDFPVLITGESGTGKDLIASALHSLSSRKDGPLVIQNCSAIPDSLLESELFGYKKGAFTGASEDKTGLLKAAEGGTVFLDEIGDMSLQLQSRVLRVIQNHEIKPLGDTRTSKINVRIVSATNKDLEEAIRRKEFRRDLFYRLNVLPLHLPPLRKRRKDIPLLLHYFFKRESLKLGIPQKGISREALAYLEDYPWEGNIRELENFVKYIVVAVDSDIVDAKHLPNHLKEGSTAEDSLTEPSYRHGEGTSSERGPLPKLAGYPLDGYSWQEVEKAYAMHVLEKNRWIVTRAANEAGVKRSTFVARMRRLGIRKS